MKLVVLFFLFLSSFAGALEGRVNKLPTENISSIYLKKIADETLQLKSLQKNFRQAPKKYCPNYSGMDESTCFKNFLQTFKVKSSSQAMLLTTAAASIGVNDGKLGYSQQMTRILMLENVIVLYENINLANFHLAEIKPKTPEGKTELSLLKKSDEQLMSGSFQKMETILLKGLTAVEKNRSVANVEEWKRKKIGELKARLLKLKKNSWKYPT